MRMRIIEQTENFVERPSRVGVMLACAWSLQAIAAPATVQVGEAWIRPSEQGTSAAVYLDITSTADMTIKRAIVPGARQIELREMAINGQTVTMQKVNAIPLKAGKKLEFRLSPRHYHIVMTGLARPLRGGQKLPLTLRLSDPKGKLFNATAQAEVRYPGGHLGLAAPDIH